jgi:FKBP-type peptidyl-prolyl cis-trans isomerase FkpA
MEIDNAQDYIRNSAIFILMPASLFQPKPIHHKRFKSLVIVLLLLPMLSFAQSAAMAQPGFKEGPHGLLYRIYNAHAGPKIQVGDLVSLNVLVKTERDSVLFSSYEQGSTTLQLVPKSEQGDVVSGILYLAEGDSATIKTNIDSIFSKTMKRPPFKGSYIVYEIKVEKVIARGNLIDTVFNVRVQDYLELRADVLKRAEPEKIKKYVAEHKLAVTVTPSGLNYLVTKPGLGDKPAVGDSAAIWYVARYVNGKVFETNIAEVARQNKMYNAETAYKPIHIQVGTKHVIPGWDEGMQLLNKGAKAIFIVPSALAYGEQGYATVPPFTPLVFEIEVVDVVKGK